MKHPADPSYLLGLTLAAGVALNAYAQTTPDVINRCNRHNRDPMAAARCIRAEMGQAPAGAPAQQVAPPVMQQPRVQARQFQVRSDVANGMLNIRNGPGTRHQILGSMPAGTLVDVYHCVPRDDGIVGAPWCEVVWQGVRGWASAAGMIPTDQASTPAPPPPPVQPLPSTAQMPPQKPDPDPPQPPQAPIHPAPAEESKRDATAHAADPWETDPNWCYEGHPATGAAKVLADKCADAWMNPNGYARKGSAEHTYTPAELRAHLEALVGRETADLCDAMLAETTRSSDWCEAHAEKHTEAEAQAWYQLCMKSDIEPTATFLHSPADKVCAYAAVAYQSGGEKSAESMINLLVTIEKNVRGLASCEADPQCAATLQREHPELK